MRIHRALLIHRLASPSAAARTATFTDSPRLRLRLAPPHSQTRLACGCGSHCHIHRLASPAAAARTATLAEVGQDLAPEQLDPLVHLGDGVGHEQHAGQRSHPGLSVGADALADRVGTADEVRLLVAAGLFAERRGPERLQWPGELRGAEALERLLVRPAAGDGELWGAVDLGAVATGPLRGTVDVLHAHGHRRGG